MAYGREQARQVGLPESRRGQLSGGRSVHRRRPQTSYPLGLVLVLGIFPALFQEFSIRHAEIEYPVL
jgi:hypothetical protein